MCRFLNHKYFLFVFMFFFLTPTLFARNLTDEDMPLEEELTDRVIYRFSEHVDKAEVAMVHLLDKTETRAEWTGQFFDFPSQESFHRIGLKKSVFLIDPKEGVTEDRLGIFINAVKESQKSLKFQEVPLGTHLVLYFGVSEADFVAESKDFIYIQIYIGKHLLKRVRLAYQPGWKRQMIDMGAVPFLNKPVEMTFNIVSDSTTEKPIYYDAVILS